LEAANALVLTATAGIHLSVHFLVNTMNL